MSKKTTGEFQDAAGGTADGSQERSPPAQEGLAAPDDVAASTFSDTQDPGTDAVEKSDLDPAESAATSPGDEGETTESPHNAGDLQQELDSVNERLLRLAAEFQNFRRRAESERTRIWGRAQADLVFVLIEVLDDLQRVSGLDPADEAVSVESIVEGVDLVERKFLRALQEAGVEAVDPRGERFDPQTMEAVMRVPAEAEEDDELVGEVFQKGYVLGGNLIRPARVSVKKHG